MLGIIGQYFASYFRWYDVLRLVLSRNRVNVVEQVGLHCFIYQFRRKRYVFSFDARINLWDNKFGDCRSRLLFYLHLCDKLSPLRIGGVNALQIKS